MMVTIVMRSECGVKTHSIVCPDSMVPKILLSLIEAGYTTFEVR